MRQDQGFDEPVISNNDLKTLRRINSELVSYINKLLNRIINLEERVKTLEN